MVATADRLTLPPFKGRGQLPSQAQTRCSSLVAIHAGSDQRAPRCIAPKLWCNYINLDWQQSQRCITGVFAQPIAFGESVCLTGAQGKHFVNVHRFLPLNKVFDLAVDCDHRHSVGQLIALYPDVTIDVQNLNIITHALI